MSKTFQIEIPITYLHTDFVKTYWSLKVPFITAGSGGSVAKAIAAKVSIIMFIQKSYDAVRGVS
jgi:hypothetical protein